MSSHQCNLYMPFLLHFFLLVISHSLIHPLIPHLVFISSFMGFFCLYKRVFWKCKYFWKNLILFLYDVNKTFRSPYLAEIVLIREPCQKYQSWLYKLFFFGIWSQYVCRNMFFVLSSGFRRLKPTGDQVESWNHPWVSEHRRFISMLHNEECQRGIFSIKFFNS